ncbi:O-antigen polymerase [Priestia koreensis]|uniref:O-antigen polymerase n=1 Tax=Priestia koreensis TaxID=284581 RepID=UPI0030190E0A
MKRVICKFIFCCALLVNSLLITLVYLNAKDNRLIALLLVVSLSLCLTYLNRFVNFLSPTFFFILFYLMLFYINPLSVMMFGWDSSEFSFLEYRTFTIYSSWGIHLFLLGHLLISNKQPLYFGKVYLKSLNRLKKILSLFLVFITIIVILIFLEYHTLNLFLLSRNSLRLEGGPIRLFVNYAGYLLSFMIFLVFFTVKKRSKKNLILWIFVIAFTMYVYIAGFRVRGYIVAHTIAIISGYYFSTVLDVEGTKLSIKKETINKTKNVLVSMIILAIIGISFRFFRGFLDPNMSLSKFQFNPEAFLRESINGGDLGYSDTVMKLFQLVPNIHGYLEGQSYYRLLFVTIPRFLWNNKPPNTEQIVGAWIKPDLESVGYTLPPGVIGDLYINFGFLGIIAMFCYGIIFSLLDRKINGVNILIWSSTPVCVFHFVRGGFTNSIIITSFLIVCAIVISRYLFSSKQQNMGK